ncbi:hypothetical protein BDY19DRAFT_909102 [Irpex rosettiformis]|uniref:Uncharacterized protein n=1 Tax=Irpex rosettiformis TaxID=378272 RepID=A0ACB8TTF6_9APHY|nr:hypothetical protein BDY19DRAFT_909102 [Irpex rosettiformis]
MSGGAGEAAQRLFTTLSRSSCCLGWIFKMARVHEGYVTSPPNDDTSVSPTKAPCRRKVLLTGDAFFDECSRASMLKLTASQLRAKMLLPSDLASLEFSEFVKYLEVQRMADYFRSAALALSIYEYSVTISEEQRSIWRHKASLASLLFLVNRHGILFENAFIVVSMVLWAGSDTPSANHVCYRLETSYSLRMSAYLSVHSVQMLNTIFVVVRTYALWDCNKTLFAFLLALGFTRPVCAIVLIEIVYHDADNCITSYADVVIHIAILLLILSMAYGAPPPRVDHIKNTTAFFISDTLGVRTGGDPRVFKFMQHLRPPNRHIVSVGTTSSHAQNTSDGQSRAYNLDVKHELLLIRESLQQTGRIPPASM